MPKHQDADLSFDVPRDWDNRTIVAYSAPPRPGQDQAANVVVTRERLAEGEDLAGYAARQLAELSTRLDDFALHGHGGRDIGGRPAVALTFSSKGREGRFDQTLVMVGVGRRVMSWTFSVPDRDAAQTGPLFERILASVRFAEPSGDVR